MTDLRNGFALPRESRRRSDSVSLGHVASCLPSLRNCVARGPRDWFSIITESDSLVVCSLDQCVRQASEAAANATTTTTTTTTRQMSRSREGEPVAGGQRRRATLPCVWRLDNASSDIEAQAWSRDGRYFVLASQRTLDVYDVERNFRLVCSKRLYFVASDVEIVRLRSPSLASTSTSTSATATSSKQHAAAAAAAAASKTTIDWRGYLIAVAGADGVQLYNFDDATSSFTVRS